MQFWKRKTRLVRLRESLRGTVALAARPTFELPGTADDAVAPPTEMLLLSPGVNRTQKGDFLFDELAASDVMAFWRENQVDLTFDYEHQALVEPPIEAPASCWKWVPEIRDGALWATAMKWTDKATSYISAKEYRYWSPALLFDEVSRRITAILNCALTNLPATKGIAPLVAASANAADPADTAKEKTMDPKDKEIADLRAELAALKTDHATLTAKLSAFEDSDKATCTVLGVSLSAPRGDRFAATNALVTLRGSLFEATGQKDVPAALGTINAWKSEAGEVVTLKAKVVALETEHAARADVEAAADFDSAIEHGVTIGKLPKSADHDIRKSLQTAVLRMGGGKPSKDGVAWLRADIAARSQFVTVTETPGNNGGTPVTGLTESEKANMTALGMNLDIAAKAKAHIEAQRVARRS